jgi:hypothetical protein
VTELPVKRLPEPPSSRIPKSWNRSQGHALDPVAVGADQVDAAVVEEPDPAVPDGDVVVAGAVVDPHPTGVAGEGLGGGDRVAAEVDGDPRGADDQAVAGAVEQVGGERGVLGDRVAAAQRLGVRRAGGQRQRPEREQDGEDEVAGGMRPSGCWLPCNPA